MGGMPRHQLWSQVQYSLGLCLGVLGERAGPPARFKEASAAIRASLEARDPVREAPVVAMTQVDLGTALRYYGEQTGDSGAMAQAIEAYRTALSIPLPEAHAGISRRARAALEELTSPRPAPPPASP
jgi:hypothetical protein